MLTAEV